MIVEPLVQGAGGMLMHPPRCWRPCPVAARHGLPLIADEIFTGFVPHGHPVRLRAGGVSLPDILCLSKALNGGTMTLAATVARSDLRRLLVQTTRGAALMHGPTFMANPLACAAAKPASTCSSGSRAFPRPAPSARGSRRGFDLRAAPGVADVRVLGAIGCVQFATRADLAALKERCWRGASWVRPFGDISLLTPALTIAEADLDRLIAAWSRPLRENR